MLHLRWRWAMKLKEWFNKKDMLMSEFADEMGYAREYIYRICADKEIPGRKLANKIYEYTGHEVTLDDLGYVDKRKCKIKCEACGKWS
jgi:transcriptional regulator with XRE-family HTH domain